MTKRTKGMRKLRAYLRLKVLWAKVRGRKGIMIKVRTGLSEKDCAIMRELVAGLPKGVRATYWPVALDRVVGEDGPRVNLIAYLLRSEMFDYYLIMEWD